MIGVVSCVPSGKGRVQVCFDNGMSCRLYIREADRLQLETGGLLSEEQYHYLMSEVLQRRAKQYALHLLERMDRPEAGLRELLRSSGYPECCVEAAVVYVKRFHYLDDERYASNYIRYAQGKRSRRQLRQKLLEKGIHAEVADRMLDQEYEGDEEAKIRSLLDKRHYDPETADRKEYARTCRYLQGKGFSFGDIIRIMGS